MKTSYIQLTAILYSLIISTAAIATDKSLIDFKPNGTMNVSQAELSQGIAGRYLVGINPDVMHQSSRVKPHNVDWAKPSGDSLDFLLFPTGENLIFKDSIRLKPERYGQYVEGVDTYSGSVVGDETGSFTLSVSNNQIIGQVQIGQTLLDIRYDEKTMSHILSVVDLLLMPKDTNEPEYSLENINSSVVNERKSFSPVFKEGTISAMSSSISNGNIRILFYYTQKVKNRNNINTLAANIISDLNTSLDLSEVDPAIDFILAGQKKLTVQIGNDADFDKYV